MNWLERTILATGLCAAASTGIAGGAAADPLAAFLWESRPILVFAPDRHDPQLREQMGRFSMHRAEYRDREVIVVEIAGQLMRAQGRAVPHAPEMRARFGVPGDAFTVILIGKDGTEKLRTGEVTDPRVFYQAIDAMPMRQQETRGE